MKKIILPIIILSNLLLAGCANIGFDESQANNFDWVAQNPGWKIATDYHNLRTRKDPNTLYTIDCPPSWNYGNVDPRLLSYYEKALIIKGVKPDHIALIRKGELCVGMSQTGMYAAWGRPIDTVEHSSALGKSIQHRYGVIYATQHSVNNTLKYVHTQNGVITSITKM